MGDWEDKIDYNFLSNGNSEIPVEFACPEKTKGRIMVIKARRRFLLNGDLVPHPVKHLYLDQMNHDYKKDIREHSQEPEEWKEYWIGPML
jgi:hypothetical protein